MIITRSPLRISLGGGGTDLPSYYREHSGFLISAAIDKYVYITIHQTFVEELIIKYSKMEHVSTVAEVQHPIIREALQMMQIESPHLEISSMADIPAGTGLGSSGSFTTALLRGLYTYKKQIVHPRELAEQACHIEIDLLKEEIGKQDQYIAALGGLTRFEFKPDDTVQAEPVSISTETLYNLEEHLLLFFTGYSRSASGVLSDQNQRTLRNDADVEINLTELKQVAHETERALLRGDLREFARLLSAQWEHKKQRTASATNEQIDEW